MTIEWLAGNRLRGTTAERPSASLQSPSVGGWVEVGRTTLGSGSSDITVSSLPNKRYYMYLINPLPSASNNSRMRFNSDSGSNYSIRRSENGASDTTLTSRTETRMDSSATDANKLIVGYISNLAGKEKLTLSHLVKGGSTGAATAPSREEDACKWVNTSNAIDEITANTGSGSYPTGSEVVVLGWDPADTHTSNFWEELASVDLSGGAADNLSSGTITAKKYLWYQIYLEDSGGTIGAQLTVNNDTSTNYTVRRAFDGGVDATSTNRTNWYADADQKASEPIFINGFIINNSSNEKLIIQHDTRIGGVGAGTAPSRQEIVGKWANTSNQITEIDVDNAGTGDFGTKSIIKVWGSD